MIPRNVRMSSLVGKTVVLDRDVELGSGIRFPAGTRCTVKYVPRTLTVITEKCPCCGVSARIIGLRRKDVSLPEGHKTYMKGARITNYEKYFSTPEKAAEMQVNMSAYEGAMVVKHFDIETMDEPVVIAQLPCEADDPAVHYEWLLSEAD